MTRSMTQPGGKGGRRLRVGRGVAFAALGFALALAAIAPTFDVLFKQGCTELARWRFCVFAEKIDERAIAALVLGVIYAVARPRLSAPLLQQAALSARTVPPLMALAAGLVLTLLPWGLIGGEPGSGSSTARLALASWTLGSLLSGVAILRMLAPWPVWGALLRKAGPLLPVLLLLGLAMPEIGDRLFPLWHLHGVTEITFETVRRFAALAGMDLIAQHSTYVLGQGAFFVEVGQSCSGIEGFALVTVFSLTYIALFRHQLAFPRIFLIIPIGLLLSFLLNAVRITLLLWIGLNVSPDLAVDGFHSNAGWLMFAALTFVGMLAVHATPWLQRAPARSNARLDAAAPTLPPLRDDWNVARILPFMVFMGSAVVVSSFFAEPETAYPLRVAAMMAALWFCRRPILRLDWGLSPLAIGAGAVIAGLWIWLGQLSGPAAQEAPALLMGGAVFAAWAVIRVLGTVMIVPLIEELFFRSYLFDLLGARRSRLGAVAAIGLSSVAFAALHQRFALALFAGLVFAALALRPRGRWSDTVICHATANAVIAGYAVLTGTWSAI